MRVKNWQMSDGIEQGSQLDSHTRALKTFAISTIPKEDPSQMKTRKILHEWEAPTIHQQF